MAQVTLAATLWHVVLELAQDVRCIACGCQLPTLIPGDCAAGYFAGEELVGIVGWCCLTAQSRTELTRLRDLRDKKAPRTRWLREAPR